MHDSQIVLRVRTMSFLLELRLRKNELAHTITKVTTPGGDVLNEERREGGFTVEKMLEGEAGFVVDTKPDLNVALVMPGLMMGSQDVARDCALLKDLAVTHVLNVGYDVTQRFEGVTYTHVQLLDIPETDLLRALPQCFAFIDGIREQGGTVFIHCNAGVSRSAAVTIAYVMQNQLIGFQEAYDKLKQLRPAIQPNCGFVNQLKAYERELGF